MTNEEIKTLKGRGWLLNKGGDTLSARVVTVNGKVTAEQMQALAAAAQRFGRGEVVLTSRMSVEVPGVPASMVEEFEAALAAVGLSVGGTGPRVRPVVACKGTLCPHGLIDTFSLAEKIHRRFYEGWHDVTLPAKFKIGVGGCPNNCVKPNLNDIGIVGAVLPGGGRGYRIFLGGHWGRTGAAGREVPSLLPDEESVLAFVEKVLNFYRSNGLPGERFCKMLERLSMVELCKMV
ncbi:MAG: (4Fe-4S)-binding protein [Kiritimatiellae bacterium]|nr:(4Fe-4S)-binding protein [Kiritimatiellia bacterium]